MSLLATYHRSSMEWLNYHHLLYFWMVAREGGLVPAGAKLRLAHPTLSGQIHALENALGEKLFSRAGRRLRRKVCRGQAVSRQGSCQTASEQWFPDADCRSLL